jgi:heme/copper-type cytochrome/quinol oxidase subunit 1
VSERLDDSRLQADDASAEEREDVGPDPVWPLGLFIVGLLVMATGGAATWHWVFNVGETLLLIGVVWFLAAVASTRLKQDPVDLRSKLPEWLAGTVAEEGPEPERAAEAPAQEAPAQEAPAAKAPAHKRKKKRKKKKRAALPGD